MGRDLAFLCRIYVNGWSTTPRSISLDESSALLIESNGTATVTGTGKAYFLKASSAPQVCSDKTPLTYTNVGVNRVGPGGSFNLTTWSGTGATSYNVSANAGVLSSTLGNGDIY